MRGTFAGAFLLLAGWSLAAEAGPIEQTKTAWDDKFRQLDEDWPTPSETRLASGAAGPLYWQQRADYDIEVTLDEDAKRIAGSLRMTYHNNSPHTLSHIWIQLDQNRFKPDSLGELARPAPDFDRLTPAAVRRHQWLESFDAGVKLLRIEDAAGAALEHRVVDTLMRIELSRPLGPGARQVIEIDWEHAIINQPAVGGRGGYECFGPDGESGECIYQIAQWYPRAAAYTDFEGWHTKPFLGRGEFTLEFGDFDLAITAPADMIVAATGVLQNPAEVLSAAQRERLAAARQSDEPVFIVTPAEALENESERDAATKTWEFEAENVRDVAFAASRKFIWDAMRVEQDGGEDVLAMSFYPHEAEPLWSTYSTKAMAHALRVYSRYSFPFPYPVIQSVNGPVYGMEYPMITFNGPRPTIDRLTGERTYGRRTKYGLISVIIHEVGHNYFPMIVNSDERQWTWMDEGMTAFVQYIAEQEWEERYPSRRGDPRWSADFMASSNQVPIMTNAESLKQVANNAYGKPAAALVVLRELVLGRENFDRAFAEYTRRWAFKRPTPTDFFRTMEDVSGVDLDWFWRGWFYSTDHVDVAIEGVEAGSIQSGDPDIDRPADRIAAAAAPLPLTARRDAETPKLVAADPSLLDFYNRHDKYTVSPARRQERALELAEMEPWEKEAYGHRATYYKITFGNEGGLVTPLPLELRYADGTSERLTLPAEIWIHDPKRASKLVVRDKELVSVEFDPDWITGDADRSDNHFPRRIEPSRIDLYRAKRARPNLMDQLDMKVEPDSVRTLAQSGDDGGYLDQEAGDTFTGEDEPAFLDGHKDGCPGLLFDERGEAAPGAGARPEAAVLEDEDPDSCALEVLDKFGAGGGGEPRRLLKP